MGVPCFGLKSAPASDTIYHYEGIPSSLAPALLPYKRMKILRAHLKTETGTLFDLLPETNIDTVIDWLIELSLGPP